MPRTTAATSKATWRQHLSQRELSDWWVVSTSGAGNAGGTTFVVSALSSYGADYANDFWGLPTSGTSAGQFRQVSDLTSGTFTVSRAYGAQIASAVTIELHKFRPDWFTTAANMALEALDYPAIYRIIESHVIGKSGQRWYSIPRNMRDVVSVRHGVYPEIKDLFDRADSATEVGNGWTATSGTWGISSEELYSVTDTDGRHLTRDPDVKDGVIEMGLRGTLNSATTYRVPALTFRIMEDRTGAIDTNNYLLVRMRNALVDLRKVDGGTESSLTTAVTTTTDGTRYVLRVQFVGARIRIWIDDQEVINYLLTGQDLRYLDGTQVGIRLDLAGAPATAARVDNYRCYDLRRVRDHQNWRARSDLQTIEFFSEWGGTAVGEDELLVFEGKALLTALDADTDSTWTLVNDSTSVLEIDTTDPMWPVFLKYGAYAMFTMAAQETDNPEDMAGYSQKAAAAFAAAQMLRGKLPVTPTYGRA